MHGSVVQSAVTAEPQRELGEETYEPPALDRGRPDLLHTGLWLVWMGTITIGGRSLNILFEELRRRSSLTMADWLEGLTLARVLPGSSGMSGSIFFITSVWGIRAAAFGIVPYVLPGLLIAFILSALAFSMPHPDWVEGGLAGFGAAALGLLFATTLRSLGGSRSGRFGILFAALAFLAHGILELNILLVLFAIGTVSLLCNRPKGRLA